MNRASRYALGLWALLLAGAGAYVLLSRPLFYPHVLAVLVFAVLFALSLALTLLVRLRSARAQRDQALAQSEQLQSHMQMAMREQEQYMQSYVARQVQELQKELADLRAREQLLEVQAHHDSLTGLANRVLLTDRFRFAVERAKRHRNSFALLMVDLNDFKIVNDRYGHAVGDAILQIMARRLIEAVRASDTVARLGGDEFVLIVESFEHAQELVHLGQKLMETLSQPVTLNSGAVVNTGASIGGAIYPSDGADMNDLLYVADKAMYQCKITGVMSLPMPLS